MIPKRIWLSVSPGVIAIKGPILKEIGPFNIIFFVGDIIYNIVLKNLAALLKGYSLNQSQGPDNSGAVGRLRRNTQADA